MQYTSTVTYRNDQTDLHTAKDNTEISTETNTKIYLVYMPEVKGSLIIDNAQHGTNDNGGKDHKRSVMKQWSQEQ